MQTRWKSAPPSLGFGELQSEQVHGVWDGPLGAVGWGWTGAWGEQEEGAEPFGIPQSL